MGGAAFASGPDALYTPRMPPAVYQAVLASSHAALRSLFAVVATPIEGPAKTDFGDVDVLVAWPKDSGNGDAALSTRDLREAAAARLGAVRSIYEGGNKVTLALPWPDVEADDEGDGGQAEKTGLDGLATVAPADKEPRPETPPETPRTPFIQLDLDIAPSLHSLQWTLFHHAHGDLWNMVGSSIRPMGLTLDETALWLRIPEIERAHRSRAKVFLTDDPTQVLHFLGLRVLDADTGQSRWEQPFASAWDLFDYVASGRFFVLFPDDESTAAHLKSNDRRRLNYRPLYRKWTTDYVPAVRPLGRHPVVSREADPQRNVESLRDHRDRVRREAFSWFPGLEYRYTAARTAWVRERHAQDIWTAAKAAVPAELPSQFRGIVCAAVRRRLGIDKKPSSSPEDDERNKQAIEDAAEKWTVEGAAEFVQAHWEEVVQQGYPVEHARYAEETRTREVNGKEEPAKVESCGIAV